MAVLTSAAIAACTNPSSPAQEGPVRLRGEISQATIARSETATITFRLENVGPSNLVLTFGSGCSILAYINDRQTAQVVYPPGGGWVCPAVITTLELPAGAAKTIEVLVRAADAAEYPYVALRPGQYEAYARIDDTTYKLRSASISIIVR